MRKQQDDDRQTAAQRHTQQHEHAARQQTESKDSSSEDAHITNSAQRHTRQRDTCRDTQAETHRQRDTCRETHAETHMQRHTCRDTQAETHRQRRHNNMKGPPVPPPALVIGREAFAPIGVGPGVARLRPLMRSWLTAAIPVDNPYCSCKRTRLQPLAVVSHGSQLRSM